MGVKPARVYSGPVAALMIKDLFKSARDGYPLKAEEILQTMQSQYEENNDLNYKPNTKIYTAVISAFANSKEIESGRKAEDLLEKLNDLKDVFPNKVTYSDVISALVKSGEKNIVQRIEEILKKMEQGYMKGNKCLEPDTIIYNNVINALTKSGVYNSAEKAEELLDKMIQLYKEGNEKMKPDSWSFSTIIHV